MSQIHEELRAPEGHTHTKISEQFCIYRDERLRLHVLARVEVDAKAVKVI